MPQPSAQDRFFDLLTSAVHAGTLTKLTLGKHRGSDPTLQNLFVRPVALKTGPHLAFLWRHDTRDVTKNHPPGTGLSELRRLLGETFLDGHLFTTTQQVQVETKPDGTGRVRITPLATAKAPPPGDHDRSKSHLIPAQAPWLRALGVTNDRGQPREGLADKFRQIQKFAELLSHLLEEAGLLTPPGPGPAPAPLRIVDAGSGKGYLTFALAELLGERANIIGLEARPELVALCNQIARDDGFAPRLSFIAGSIADVPAEPCDVLIALHACDTATDDALARGIAAGAKLLVVAPCCQKELRAQLTAPAVLTDALRHGIFQERQAEFVTDALRAQLLEWAGHRTKVFEFISTEHTAKNLMIAAIRSGPAQAADTAHRVRTFAQFYGIQRQQLARHLGFDLTEKL